MLQPGAGALAGEPAEQEAAQYPADFGAVVVAVPDTAPDFLVMCLSKEIFYRLKSTAT